jgi:hypothetical protein
MELERNGAEEPNEELRGARRGVARLAPGDQPCPGDSSSRSRAALSAWYSLKPL